ncbi:UvrD-helicase domain-containing protein [Clostridium perfringens]|uniref:UvrD-helicase domain-containing protein n=1 Tax=Clostridium perfringens TaxID=1502 RepID=UPI001ABB6773|nr:ATP-dependent helicase [Clostridium perfringens]MBO3333588.1 ATP-dependent helicase [Clostridium perfringens]
MFNIIDRNKWEPVDGIILEENALEVVKSNRNMLVVAGPGAGKSELLAQRACYLLQTNECKEPNRILALSFKKDAASNISERVVKRCGEELGERFDSMTFDAFSRALVDQFLNAIPKEYRPKRNYELITTDKEMVEILKNNKKINLTDNKKYFHIVKKLTEYELPFEKSQNEIKELWDYILGSNEEEICYLTFKMIGRLAEYLIRKNPMIKKVLNMTYSHLFLDEYQDTTSMQYKLLKSCFYNTDIVITAVGDDKQRIMVWAGALKDAFNRYKCDFDAIETMLVMNHRSAPRLLTLQKSIYKEFFYKDSIQDCTIKNNPKWDDEAGEAYVHIFPNDKIEAIEISAQINKLIESGYNKREICILVKQTPDKYCKDIIENLEKNHNIIARNEMIFQEILKEDLINILNDIIAILINKKSPEEWSRFIDLIMEFNECSLTDIYEIRLLEDSILKNILKFKEVLLKVSSEEELYKFINDILEFIGIEKLKGKYDNYKNESTFRYYINTYCDLLWREYIKCKKWNKAIENLKGENSIPIMTIHKSKGLEYDVVFFIGLEDGAFWSFENQKDEDFCTFFVALSRAKKRVDFTFSKIRKYTRNYQENRVKIKEFYEILEKSGVVDSKFYEDSKNYELLLI